MINIFLENSKFKKYISVSLLVCIMAGVFVLGLQAMENEKRITFDGSLYNWFGSKLSGNYLDYSPLDFWKKVEATLPEGKDKEVARTYLEKPLFKHPPLFSYFIAFSKSLFGDTNRSARYVPLFFRIAAILVIFLITKNIMGYYWALLAAFFAAIEPVFMFCSQKIWLETICSFFMLSGFCFLFGAKKKKRYFYVSAVMLGLAMLCKYTAILGVISAFTYVFFMEEVKDKKTTISYIVIPFLVFSPWLIWNLNVYGIGFFGKIISLNSSDLSNISYGYVTGCIGIAASLVAGLVGSILFKEKIRSWFKEISGYPYFSAAADIGKWIVQSVAILLFLVSLPSLLKGLTWGSDPAVTSSMHMFEGAPPFFYFSHLIELAPIYIFSFISIFFIREKDINVAVLFCFSLLSFIFAASFKDYETRYIAMVAPALMVLAVFSIREIVRFIFNQEGQGRLLNLILFLFIVAFMVLKTIRLDIGTVVKNNFIYF